jgi:hypothetical protein
MTTLQETDSPIPRVLLRAPRSVRRKPGTLGLLLFGRVLTAPLLACCVALTAFVILEPIIFMVPAQAARVVRLWSEFRAHEGTSFYIRYRFDRSAFIGQCEVLPEEYRNFQVGQAVNAHLVHLGVLGYSVLGRSLSAYAHFRMILWFGAFFGAAIGAVVFYAVWILPWRSHWLTQNGKATFGAVVEKSMILGARRHFYFTLKYQYKAFGVLWARRINISPQRFDAAGEKDLIIILFDPARPSRNIIYDYCDFVAC